MIGYPIKSGCPIDNTYFVLLIVKLLDRFSDLCIEDKN